MYWNESVSLSLRRSSSTNTLCTCGAMGPLGLARSQHHLSSRGDVSPSLFLARYLAQQIHPPNPSGICILWDNPKACQGSTAELTEFAVCTAPLPCHYLEPLR